MEVQAQAARVLRAVVLVTRLAMVHQHRQGVLDALQAVQADVPDLVVADVQVLAVPAVQGAAQVLAAVAVALVAPAPAVAGVQVLAVLVALAAVQVLAAVAVLRVALAIVKIAVVDAVALVLEIVKLLVQDALVLAVALAGLGVIQVASLHAKAIVLAVANNTARF